MCGAEVAALIPTSLEVSERFLNGRSVADNGVSNGSQVSRRGGRATRSAAYPPTLPPISQLHSRPLCLHPDTNGAALHPL